MIKSKKILIPDKLPNRLRDIRENKGLKAEEVARAMDIDPNFYRFVENEETNFSGKSTIKAFTVLTVNFYQVFDVKEKRECEVTDEFENVFNTNIEVSIYDIIGDKYKSNDPVEVKNIAIELIDKHPKGKYSVRGSFSNNNLIINKCIRKAKKENIKGNFDRFEVLGYIFKDGKIMLSLNVYFLEKRREKLVFDINFMENLDKKLIKKLAVDGKIFQEKNERLTRVVDGKKVKFKEDYFLLDKKYKFKQPYNNNKESRKIYLTNPYLEVKYNEKTKDPIAITFEATMPARNNLVKLREEFGITQEEMATLMGIGYNSYSSFEKIGKYISTRLMWRLVSLFKVPLEYIINIDDFYQRQREDELMKKLSEE